MPSMTWLLESTSFSLGFLLRKMVGTGKQAGTALSRPLERRLRSPPPTAPVPAGRAVIVPAGTVEFTESRLPTPPTPCLSVSGAMSQNLQAPALFPGPWYLH